MKKLLFFITLMLSPMLASAQTVSNYSYHPFLKEGKTWNCQEYYNNIWNDEHWTKNVSYVINGTTEIDGKTYYKLYRISEEGNKYYCALREEDRKVWQYTSYNGEHLLYNFGMSIGDSYMPSNEPYYYYQLAAIEPMQFHNNQLLNVFTYDILLQYDPTGPAVYFESTPIVEGVGCLKGWNIMTLYAAQASNGIFHGENFLSCYEDEECIFTKEDFDKAKIHEYFPEGTKWTEIRLDTLKYDSWYSKVGDEWVPNFETIEYYVKGKYVQGESDNIQTFKKVYSNGPEWTDSLTLMVMEGGQAQDIYGHNGIFVSVPVRDYEGNTYVPWPGEAYQFDWSIGTGIYFTDITMANTTSIVQYHNYYGIIDEIKEGDFGGVRPLKYVDLDGKAPECGIYDNPQLIDTNGGRVIQGIGITEWNDGECLFGPPNPYFALRMFDYDGNLYPERHYRSMLVHFERNGEVLYDVWPKPDDDMAYRPFVEEGKMWKVGTIPSTPESPVQVVDYYYFDGDTIVDGKTCKQMWCQRFVSPDSPDYSTLTQTPSLSKVGAWYEEDKKVYVCREGTQGMEMLYDFSLEANDTLILNDYQPYYIVGPKQIGGLKGFKGIYRDIMLCGQDIYITTWLEGVGGIDGPLRNVYPETESDPQFLMSCTVGDEVIYLNDEYEDGATPEALRAAKKRFDFTHTTKLQPKAPIERENSDACISSSEREVARPKVKTPRRGEEELSLYGEYNNLQLGIHLDPLDDAYQVSITNESGEAVYEKTINAGTIVGLSIDISAYAKGRYTVTVENSNELFTGEFETQTTGIETIRHQTSAVGHRIYNLQGQRLSSLQKGLNIVNGQKVYVK